MQINYLTIRVYNIMHEILLVEFSTRCMRTKPPIQKPQVDSSIKKWYREKSFDQVIYC